MDNKKQIDEWGKAIFDTLNRHYAKFSDLRDVVYKLEKRVEILENLVWLFTAFVLLLFLIFVCWTLQ